jgi:hypothetical protein
MVLVIFLTKQKCPVPKEHRAFFSTFAENFTQVFTLPFKKQDYLFHTLLIHYVGFIYALSIQYPGLQFDTVHLQSQLFLMNIRMPGLLNLRVEHFCQRAKVGWQVPDRNKPVIGKNKQSFTIEP